MPVKGVILAAGMASRLRPLTDHSPKCLLKVGDRCLLQRTVDALVSNGITELVVVTGYLHEMIEDFLKVTYPQMTIHFINNDVYQTTNNIYSLWLTRPYCEGEDILLMDSDILCDPKIVNVMLSQPGNAIALNRHECGEEEMKICIDSEQNITEISKTCSCEEAVGESVGFERMTAAYTSALFPELDTMMNQEHLENTFYELAFERLIKKGHTYKVIDTTDIFSMELDTVEDFNNALKVIPEGV